MQLRQEKERVGPSTFKLEVSREEAKQLIMSLVDQLQDAAFLPPAFRIDYHEKEIGCTYSTGNSGSDFTIALKPNKE